MEVIAIVVVLTLLALLIWQCLRYLHIRRKRAQDLQPQLHSSRTLHIMVFCTGKDGSKLVPSLAHFCADIAKATPARLIYAGQAAFTQASVQLEKKEWNAVLLYQFADRADYERHAGLLQGTARRAFTDHHVHAMSRNRLASLMVPVELLRLRMSDLLRGKWRIPPLEHLPAFKKSTEYDVWRWRVERLRALHLVNPNAAVVFSLVRYADAAQRAISRRYGRAMRRRMAALSHGPLHLGRAVGVQGQVRFDRALAVYYPSADYLAELLSSEFFQGMIEKNQLADTMVVPTVPLTEHIVDLMAAPNLKEPSP